MAKDSVEKTQEEIVQEMAKALGHTGSLLEETLKQLKEIELSMSQIEDIEEYNCIVDRFNAVRDSAIFRREMLIIHREALGMRQHKFMDICYPIPPRKKKR
ncbi:MAG: hypothetical protein J7L53_04315 [Deltaproteobacteria bacterium]|nr:hypothetical protein [Deltaproteobacteria bacterium]